MKCELVGFFSRYKIEDVDFLQFSGGIIKMDSPKDFEALEKLKESKKLKISTENNFFLIAFPIRLVSRNSL